MKDYGWLDTNLFVHPFFENDPHRDQCEQILEEIRRGGARGSIDVITVHELTYILPRISERFRDGENPDREEIFSFLSPILGLETIESIDKERLLEILLVWADSGISFADARLQVLARERGRGICSVNQTDFEEIRNTFSGD